MQYVAVGAGAVLGATLRYVVTNWAAGRWGGEFPYGTLLVNVSGAFVIGMLLAVLAKQTAVDPLLRLFLATGFLGGYTTFSAYAWEALTLAQDGAWWRALLYVGGSNVLGLAGVWVGSQLMTLRGG
ncbi:MAG: fluoride efflux transporter CrcB [Chloroflexi bacterium]|nr:fluoride efflux transporter CrcB [Chloroflexota bacterium]